MDQELTGEEIFKLLMERDKDLLTKLYEGTYKEEEEEYIHALLFHIPNHITMQQVIPEHNIFEYFYKPISDVLYSACPLSDKETQHLLLLHRRQDQRVPYLYTKNHIL
jgi:hypothetical protein